MTRTRTLGRERTLPSDFPPSKYSISSDVCDGCDPRSRESLLAVVIVTGLPSSGTEYEVLSVRRETSVARSSPRVVSLSMELRTEGSVGAGKGG